MLIPFRIRNDTLSTIACRTICTVAAKSSRLVSNAKWNKDSRAFWNEVFSQYFKDPDSLRKTDSQTYPKTSIKEKYIAMM